MIGSIYDIESHVTHPGISSMKHYSSIILHQVLFFFPFLVSITP